MGLTIIAPYPTSQNIKDGMLIRVKSIDDLISGRARKYLNLSLNNKPFSEPIQHNNLVIEFRLNPIFDLFRIIRLLSNSSTIYAHSIVAFKFIPLALLFIKRQKQNLILDAHGVVPEEFLMHDKDLKAGYLNFIEREVFKRISHCISVSDTMNRHFQNKYIDINNSWKSHLYYIYNSTLTKPDVIFEIELKEKFKISDNDCVLIYSGNAQKWQNIDKMFKTISALDLTNIKVIILTGDLKKFKELIIQYDLEGKVILDSVAPDELGGYYNISHYGFLLRDDIVVNNVANPTKMLEYLSFGIIPIVISPKIGDYVSLGYEYISLDEVAYNIPPKKSLKNIEISQLVFDKNKEFDFNKNILDNGV